MKKLLAILLCVLLLAGLFAACAENPKPSENPPATQGNNPNPPETKKPDEPAPGGEKVKITYSYWGTPE